MPGIYSINSPQKLFEKLARSFERFYRDPSDDGLFEVLFPLYHLREWICPGGHESYKDKPEIQRTDEERLHASLHGMHEYEIVRALCNASKHYVSDSNNSLEGRMEELKGARAGLMRVGDSLGVTHFTVDGRDVRDYFMPVYQVYYSYFHPHDPAA